MATENRKTKDRSPNFPFIDLESALARAQEFYAAEKRGSAPIEAVAKHWRYSPASSGLLQTTAALKSYGLMTDDGSGASRSIRLTELALRVLLDPRPNSAEKAQYMRQAALTPAVSSEIYSRWPDGLPSQPTLLHYLVLERGFGEQKAQSVCKIIHKNEELTASSSVGIESSQAEVGNEGARDKESRNTSGLGVASTHPSLIRAAPMATAANSERLQFPGAEILINFDGPPTYATFAFIERYMQLRKELFAKSKPPAGSVNGDESDT